MNSPSDKSGLFAGLLFLIWPFLSVISAFRNYDSDWAKNILWAFIAFYGFTFAIGAESQSSDIVRYVAEIKYLHNTPMTASSALDYFLQSGQIDIIDTFITLILSRVTESQAVIILVYGIIFGFFFSRNMWYVLDRLEGKIQLVTILLFACFFLVIPIWNMNGFRMWTASHIFIYGVLPYLFEGKKSGAIIASLSILVHFSFIVPIGILFSYILLGNRLVIYFCFFITTFFISEIDIDTFNRFVENYAPEVFQERTSSYRSESNVEDFREENPSNKNWYAVWYGTALRWSVMGFLTVLFFKGREFFNENYRWMSLFAFTLLFYGVANLFSSLPSGGRFLSVANLIALALISLYIQNRERDLFLKRFILAATPALMLFLIIAVRTGLYSMSATSVLGNPVIALFLNGEHISLNDVLKMIL